LTEEATEPPARRIVFSFFVQATEKLRFTHCQINFLQLIRIVEIRFKRHMVKKKQWLSQMKKGWNRTVMASLEDGDPEKLKTPEDFLISQSIQMIPEYFLIF
jgi:hypothetical protein